MRWANHACLWQFYRIHCTYSYECQCWSATQPWNKSILALITLTALKEQGNCFIYIVNSVESIDWCKKEVQVTVICIIQWLLQMILKAMTHRDETYICVTVCSNLNLSSLLSDIIASGFLHGLCIDWRKKAPVKEASDFLMKSHLTPICRYSHAATASTVSPLCLFPNAVHKTHSFRWDEAFTSADICQAMVITCTFKLTRQAQPTLSTTLDMRQQELSKLSRCQTVTYHVHITTARRSGSLWFILPGWWWQWPCEECFNLTTLWRRLLQLYSRWWQTKLLLLSQGWQTVPMLQGVIDCLWRRTLRWLSQKRRDSWSQLMSRKWLKVRGDQSHVRPSTRKLQVWGGVSLLGEYDFNT